jgi:hypothetical protein
MLKGINVWKKAKDPFYVVAVDNYLYEMSEAADAPDGVCVYLGEYGQAFGRHKLVPNGGSWGVKVPVKSLPPVLRRRLAELILDSADHDGVAMQRYTARAYGSEDAATVAQVDETAHYRSEG